jgi:hypothetical protein
MSKFLLSLSGGKDSLAAYLRLKETFGSDSIKTFTIKSSNDVVWDTNLDLISEMYEDNIILDCGNKVYYDAFGQMLNDHNINPTEYYFSSGELDFMHETADYYPLISHFGFKGFTTPFYGKPKELVFDILQKYNCEFIITQAFVPPGSDIDEVYSHIGRIVTATELKDMYLNKAFQYFFAYQTFAVKCDSVITLNQDKIAKLHESINAVKNKTTSIIVM